MQGIIIFLVYFNKILDEIAEMCLNKASVVGNTSECPISPPCGLYSCCSPETSSIVRQQAELRLRRITWMRIRMVPTQSFLRRQIMFEKTMVRGLLAAVVAAM